MCPKVESITHNLGTLGQNFLVSINGGNGASKQGLPREGVKCAN